MDTPDTFAELLRSFRIARSLTQSELAERAGLSPRGISDLERGERTQPRPGTVRNLAKALKLSPEQRSAFIAAARSTRREGNGRRLSSTVGLPGYLPNLIGRETDVDAIKTLLTREHQQLVTLTGPGGVGKTRVALQVAAELAEEFPDGVWFVRLAPLTDYTLVLSTIAQMLALRESGEQAIERVLLEHLRTRRVLLLLDNFEHLREAAPNVALLLAESPGLSVLVTSRAPLHLRGEQILPLPPLALADLQRLPALAELTQCPALALFTQRAQAVYPAFQMTIANAPAVAEICARLDGLPLAIELAAAWVRLLPPETLLTRLASHRSLLAGGARDLEPRQQTMRATIAWSEELLEPDEQRLFGRLAVFVSGGTLEAIEEVCGAPAGAEPLETEVLVTLGALVDASLVQQVEVAGEARFSLLHVIREYALERLQATGEAEVLRRAHAGYFLDLVEPPDYLQVTREQGTEWLTRLEHEHDNLRAALTWACTRGELEMGLRLGASVAGYWLQRSYLREGRAWLEKLVALGVGQAAGEVERVHGVEAVVLVKQRAGVDAVRAWVHALGFAGVFANLLGEGAQAMAMWEEGVIAARTLGDTRMLVAGIHLLGLVELEAGDTAHGLALSEESLELARQLEDNTEILITILMQYSQALLMVPGEESRAVTLAEESLELAQRAGTPSQEAVPRQLLALIALRRGDFDRAGELMAAALRLAWDHGLTLYLPDFLDEMALVAEGTGHSERAVRLLGAAARMFEITGLQPDHSLYPDMEAMMGRTKAALGEEVWGVAYAAGWSLLLEEAIAEALSEVLVEMSSQVATTDGSPELTLGDGPTGLNK